MVKKWKHGIGPDCINTLNSSLEFLSTSIPEIVNIDECSHKNAIIIFITKQIKEKITIMLQKMTM